MTTQLEGNNAVSVEQIILGVVSQNTDAIGELQKTLVDMRLSLKGMQTEVESHNKVLEQMAKSIDEIKTAGSEIKSTNEELRALRSQLVAHEQSGLESRKRINERLDEQGKKISIIEGGLPELEKKIHNEVETVDEKSKIDLVKLGVNLFLTTVASGTTLLTAVITAKNTIEASCTLTVS